MSDSVHNPDQYMGSLRHILASAGSTVRFYPPSRPVGAGSRRYDLCGSRQTSCIFWSREKSEGGVWRPLLIVMEEAHRYLHEEGESFAADIVRRIAKEGRKYGVGAMIVSQRPAEIDETVLSQCASTDGLLDTLGAEDLHFHDNRHEALCRWVLEAHGHSHPSNSAERRACAMRALASTT